MQTRLEWLLQTEGSVVGLILRLTLTGVMFPHGAQKVLGWFGGPNLVIISWVCAILDERGL